ncbi:MAG: stage II sporulation protein M [Bacteroidota bacterium]
MRETSFIKQNKEKWKEFESILEKKDKDPDKLNDLFIQITDDLSYSRTFYPNRSVRVYLNNLAQQVFHSIYKNKKSRFSRLLFFWTDELPQLVYESRQAFRLSFFTFVLALAIGALSSAMEPEFCRVILGDSYVDMTLENIESGDPMAVYKSGGQFSSSLGITFNNVRVAFLTFVLGVFFIVGAVAILISNGIMVGAFQYFFYEQGLLRESALTIWMHGALEISAIVIAGAAGITMGMGLVFPGTLTRLKAFQLSARRGLKIMIGITPIIILAGFIEGYLTRYTETPDWIRAIFILSCFAFIISYFVIYPVQKARMGFRPNLGSRGLGADQHKSVKVGQIFTIGELFSDIFLLFRKHLRPLLLSAAGGAVLYCLCVFPFVPLGADEPFRIHGLEDLLALTSMTQFFAEPDLYQTYAANWIQYTLVCYVSLYLVYREVEDANRQRSLLDVVKIGLVCLLLVLFFSLTGGLGPLLFLLVAPVTLIWMYTFISEGRSWMAGLSRSFTLLRSHFGRVLGLSTLLGILSLVLFSILHSSLLWLYVEMVTWNFSVESELALRLQTIIATFIGVFMLGLMAEIFLLGMALQYYTLLEIHEAPHLLDRIQQIGTRQRIQGLAKEY